MCSSDLGRDYGSTMTDVRVAAADDIDAICRTVAAAFAADPAWSFIAGESDDASTAAKEAFARTLAIPRVQRGTVWVTDDCAAVAMWDRCTIDGPVDDDAQERWAAFRAEVGEDVWSRLDAYDHAVKMVAPPRPYWYLGVLATRPDAQGRGLASAVLAPGLRAAAQDNWSCWLEIGRAHV